MMSADVNNKTPDENIETEATIGLFRLRSIVDNAQDELATVIVMQNICDAADKGDCGARAVKALFELWGQLKLRQIDGPSISDLRAVVDEMHHKSAAQLKSKRSPKES